MLSTRVNIMFDEKTWIKLKALAKKQRATTSELVRRAVHDQYMNKVAVQRMKAVEKILQIRPDPVKGKIDYKELINEGRTL